MALPTRKRPRFPLKSVSSIRKLPEASYPHPSEGKQTENHNHRKLTNLITWTTALANSMKLWAVLCRATQDGWVVVESSDKAWSTGEGNGKPLQYSSLENPMNSRLYLRMVRCRYWNDVISKPSQLCFPLVSFPNSSKHSESLTSCPRPYMHYLILTFRQLPVLSHYLIE